MKTSSLFLAVILIAFVCRAQEVAPAQENRVDPKVVSLFAGGEAKVTADTVVVHLSHRAEAAKLTDALALSSAAKEKLLDSLAAAGIPKNSVVFQNFSSEAEHGSLLGKVKGYAVTSPIEVRIKTEADFGKIAVLVDSNPDLRLGSRRPDLADASSLQFKAAEKAVENLRKKAALYEKAFGVKLEMHSFSEVSQESMKTNPTKNFTSDTIDGLLLPAYSAKASTPSFGELKTEVNLRGVYRIVD